MMNDQICNYCCDFFGVPVLHRGTALADGVGCGQDASFAVPRQV